MSEFVFKQLDRDPESFFGMLPQDWQDEIVPYWEKYKDSSEIVVIQEATEIIGGGIIFSACPPDLTYYKEEAQKWFDKGFLYIGFLWINVELRNANLGSFWLDELKKINPNQSFWLIIEEERLHRFYQRNEFVLVETIRSQGHEEWLYVYDSQD